MVGFQVWLLVLGQRAVLTPLAAPAQPAILASSPLFEAEIWDTERPQGLRARNNENKQTICGRAGDGAEFSHLSASSPRSPCLPRSLRRLPEPFQSPPWQLAEPWMLIKNLVSNGEQHTPLYSLGRSKQVNNLLYSERESSPILNILLTSTKRLLSVAQVNLSLGFVTCF